MTSADQDIQGKKDQLNGMANEVLNFVGKELSKIKYVRCQCGEPRQRVGYLCFACGGVVQDE